MFIFFTFHFTFQCGLCKKYCKASDRLLECEECEKSFHASCSNLSDNELLRIESGDGAWYCTNCKADCGLCSGAVLKGHKAVRCDSCDMWIHNECSFIAETQYETVNNTNCTWICPKCGGGVMLLVHKDISHMHMPITELENDSESIWLNVFANKTSHFVASWYRPPSSTSEEFQLFREQLDYIRTHHKGKKLPSAHVLGDFNFTNIDWPDRLSKTVQR